MTAVPAPSHQALHIRKAAVLGAGVMGAQIAAHLANAGVETVLFDLPADSAPKSTIALKAIAQLAKLSPAPLAHKALTQAITDRKSTRLNSSHSSTSRMPSSA